MQNSRKGFTLAEVLVTLAIIGVVAALTIPTLIQNTNSQKYQTGLKKAVSVLNQAIMTNVAQNGVDAATLSAATDVGLATFFAGSLNVLKNDAAGTLWLADGSKMFFDYVSTCDDIADPSSVADPAALPCSVIVDVNGDKGPNTTATVASPADLYVLGITATSVVPLGGVTSALTLPAGFELDANGTALTYTHTAAAGNASMNAVTGGST